MLLVTMPANTEPLIQFCAFQLPNEEHLLKLEDIFFLFLSFKNDFWVMFCHTFFFFFKSYSYKNCARKFLANANYAVCWEKDSFTHLDSKLNKTQRWTNNLLLYTFLDLFFLVCTIKWYHSSSFKVIPNWLKYRIPLLHCPP